MRRFDSGPRLQFQKYLQPFEGNSFLTSFLCLTIVRPVSVVSCHGWSRIIARGVFACLLIAAIRTQARAVFDTVVLDPGHGGWDQGGLRNVKVPEKKMTLLTALAVRERLEEAGVKVIMTRETDVYIPLSDRVSIANAHDGAIFVSIHYNADYGTSGHGVETYCARGSSKSVPLRNMIHRNLVGRTGARDRGVRTAGFYVLRHTDTVAVLVEGGFLSNPREASKVADEGYRDLIADCISDGILDYRDSLNGSRLPRGKKKQEDQEEKRSKPDKPKEATPVEESNLPPDHQKAKKPSAAKVEPKKKPPAAKPAEAKKPSEAKKPASTNNTSRTEKKAMTPAAPEPKTTPIVTGETNRVSLEHEPVPSAQSPKLEETPKDTNSPSAAPVAEASLKQEPGPKAAAPSPEPPPQSPEAVPRTTNPFRASGIRLRD